MGGMGVGVLGAATGTSVGLNACKARTGQLGKTGEIWKSRQLWIA